MSADSDRAALIKQIGQLGAGTLLGLLLALVMWINYQRDLTLDRKVELALNKQTAALENQAQAEERQAEAFEKMAENQSLLHAVLEQIVEKSTK